MQVRVVEFQLIAGVEYYPPNLQKILSKRRALCGESDNSLMVMVGKEGRVPPNKIWEARVTDVFPEFWGYFSAESRTRSDSDGAPPPKGRKNPALRSKILPDPGWGDRG